MAVNVFFVVIGDIVGGITFPYGNMHEHARNKKKMLET